MSEFKIVRPKIDVVFKKLFGDENRKGLLIDLITSLLDLEEGSVKDIEVKNPEITPDTEEDKFPRLDLLLETKDKQIDLEMQTYNTGDFIDREIVYFSRMIGSDIKKGKPYNTLRENISISILDFNHSIFSNSGYVSKFTLYDPVNKISLSDKVQMYFFELHKLKDLDKELSNFSQKELWLKFLNSEDEEEFNMIKQLNNPTINEAIDVVESMNDDPAIVELVRQSYFWDHERASLLETGKEKGIEIGLAKGREEERETWISVMRKSGYTEKQIDDLLKQIRTN